MEVIKRDGSLQEYNGDKIEIAIIKAMRASLDHEMTEKEHELVSRITRNIEDKIRTSGRPWKIREIEIEICTELTSFGYAIVAINYIEYKTHKDIQRQEHLLSDEFLAKYPDYPASMNALARFTYMRTYSRWIPEQNRRETWKETCARAINGNCSYLPTEYGEAERLFDNMFYLKQRVSGRLLWMGGTEALKKTPLAAYNCSGIVMNTLGAFNELFYLLMVGTGVGCRVLKEDIAKLPKLHLGLKLYHTKLKKPEGAHLEHSKVDKYGSAMVVTVGDSKNGWCEALEAFFQAHLDPDVQTLTMDYTYVRPNGAVLKTFGGYASGSESIQRMFDKIKKVLEEDTEDGVLRPINVSDICNIIGENVVCGGTRRTAELILFSPDDEEMIHAKENLDENHYHRFLSNNSMYIDYKPSLVEIQALMKSIRETGEPGFVNAISAKRSRADFEIVNPCAEILLPSRAVCNLTNINVSAFVSVDKGIDMEGLEEACKLSARACYRLTEPKLELPGWSEIHNRDRLIGCSLTGWQDFVSLANINHNQEAEILRKLKGWIVKYSDEYAESLHRPKPVLHTTCQPDGTGGLISNGISAGIHYSHAPYFFRRVRIQASSPLFKAVSNLGWQIDNEVGQTDENCTTKVITFPCHSDSLVTKYDVTAIDQLENYKRFQENYVEHNTSITVTVRPDEWDGVAQWIFDNWNIVTAISFLALDQTYYPLAPYETCTKEQYEELKAKMKPFNQDLVNKYEFELQMVGQDFDVDDQSDCEDGLCPVR